VSNPPHNNLAKVEHRIMTSSITSLPISASAAACSSTNSSPSSLVPISVNISNLKMKFSTSALVLASAASASAATIDFANVTHVATATIAFGVATTSIDDFYAPIATNAAPLGVMISHDGAKTTEVTDVAGDVKAAMLMGVAAKGDEVLVGGLLGAGASSDAGETFASVESVKVIVTQDIKYEEASGLFMMTGSINGVFGVAHSETADGVFTIKALTGTKDDSAIRYASLPSDKVFYAVTGM
jgi:hypothetical protein